MRLKSLGFTGKKGRQQTPTEKYLTVGMTMVAAAWLSDRPTPHANVSERRWSSDAATQAKCLNCETPAASESIRPQPMAATSCNCRTYKPHQKEAFVKLT